ncbi:type II secretion system protein C (GspC) [Alkalispirillum mobile]|uniref:Type II secretion system protein C (GspC) n=1 Tax=Alkalispirillum mobile TaxID=85925 RepID=A0A498BXA5_9GAMM|nr:type II secretion system protein GspC [Alkalispirillum mobile]RLK48344.1 type II secretion system protein C (GspC) [Alkalispirillum mobile]
MPKTIASLRRADLGRLGNRLLQSRWLRRALALVLVILLAQGGAQLTWWSLGYSPADQIPAAAIDANTPAGPESAGRASEARQGLGHVASMSLLGEATEEDADQAVIADDLPETRLNLQLQGVVSRGGQGAGAALIASGGSVAVYRVSQEVPGGAELVQVQADRVILRRDGQHEALKLPRSLAEVQTAEVFAQPDSNGRQASASATERTPPSAARIDAQELASLRDTLADNPEQLWEMVNVRPVMEQGQLQGYRLQPREHQALFREAGLRDDDVVTAVNGVPLDNPARMGELLEGLGTTSRLDLDVRRDGRTETIVVEFE